MGGCSSHLPIDSTRMFRRCWSWLILRRPWCLWRLTMLTPWGEFLAARSNHNNPPSALVATQIGNSTSLDRCMVTTGVRKRSTCPSSGILQFPINVTDHCIAAMATAPDSGTWWPTVKETTHRLIAQMSPLGWTHQQNCGLDRFNFYIVPDWGYSFTAWLYFIIFL